MPSNKTDSTVIIRAFLKYARLLSNRNLVCNTFGNIALKISDPTLGKEVIYTKHRGVSLEEMGRENIVVTDLATDSLLVGTIPPSIGHQMHREIFKLRPEVQALIHLHPDEIISYFSVFHAEGMPFISNDTALVLQSPVKVLPPEVNVEIDLGPLKEFIQGTNCIVMPHHGITVLGETLSEAYHRTCSVIAETKRATLARILAATAGRKMPAVADDEVEHMYKIGKSVIYGK